MRRLLCALTMVACLVGANDSFADRIPGLVGQVKLDRGGGALNGGSGGEFRLQGDIYDSGSFLTGGHSGFDAFSFCVETDELFYPNRSYYFAITDFAVEGGNGGVLVTDGTNSNNADRLSLESKVIFDDWLDGRGSANTTDATLVMNAIRHAEDEFFPNTTDLVPANSLNNAFESNPTTPSRTIRVMTLFNKNGVDIADVAEFAENNNGVLFDTLIGNAVQDQIVAVVPEPGTMSLALMGAACFGGLGLRRRRR